MIAIALDTTRSRAPVTVGLMNGARTLLDISRRRDDLSQAARGVRPSHFLRRGRPGMIDALVISIPGRIVSNNRVTRHVEGKALKSTEARRDQARIAEQARQAAFLSQWEPLITACELQIIAWNTRKDVGNVEKVIADALSGIAYDDDRRLVRLVVEKRRDKLGERYDVAVRPLSRLQGVAQGFERPKVSPEPITRPAASRRGESSRSERTVRLEGLAGTVEMPISEVLARMGGRRTT